jgi:hypothetical protein
VKLLIYTVSGSPAVGLGRINFIPPLADMRLGIASALGAYDEDLCVQRGILGVIVLDLFCVRADI